MTTANLINSALNLVQKKKARGVALFLSDNENYLIQCGVFFWPESTKTNNTHKLKKIC